MNLPKDFIERLKAVKAKRPRTVIEHILKHGFVTTEELKSKYGYNHPPRAARDVREQGIPLETFTVVGSDGRKIAAYRFADPSKIRRALIGGRRAFPKSLKADLMKPHGPRCNICQQVYQERYLQIDHRIPYEVVGDTHFHTKELLAFMLLCGSCNRAKSWSCEHCPNWLEKKSPEICRSCYWAHPESYNHVAMMDERRLAIVWQGKETGVYDNLHATAQASGESLPTYVKRVLARIVQK